MEINEAKEILKNAGYYVDKLWSVHDVNSRFKCDNETAMGILSSVLTSDHIGREINEVIEIVARAKFTIAKVLGESAWHFINNG